VRARAALGYGLASLAVAAAGCSSVLGLDAPTLDPCVESACPDATAEASIDASDGAATQDAQPGVDAGDAAGEAAPACLWDGGLPDASGGGIRCGGGCSPVTFCTGGQICCQTTSDAGGTAFACAASESACSGYSIDCVNENDCTGSDVCCHYVAHMVCAASCTSSADITCIPGSADDCPTGKACDVRLVNADAAVPYYACEP